MAKVIPTICVTEIGDESGQIIKINKSDFDAEKYKIAKRVLEPETPETPETGETGEGDSEPDAGEDGDTADKKGKKKASK